MDNPEIHINRVKTDPPFKVILTSASETSGPERTDLSGIALQGKR
jgi:hypothetical protein